MHFSRIQNSRTNLIWNLILKIFNIFFPFLLRSLLIRIIGLEYAGLSSLFSSILQVLNVTELGIDTSIVFCLYKPVAEDDYRTINALMNLYKKAYLIIGGAILLLGITFLPFLEKFIKEDVPETFNIYYLYLISLLNTVFSYTFFSYKSCILRTCQKEYIIARHSIFTNFLLFPFQIISLCVLKNYYFFVALGILSTCVLNVLNYIYVTRNFNNIKPCGKISIELKGNIVKNIKGLLVLKVCGILRNSLDNVIISSFIGLAAVGLYNNYYTIVISLVSMISIIKTSIQSGVGNSVAIESVEKNYIDYNVYKQLMFWLNGFCCICLGCLFQLFIEIWLGAEYLLPWYMPILFSVYFYLIEIGEISYTYRIAAGLWSHDIARPLIEGISNLILNLIFVQKWGMAGVLLSTIITYIFITIPWTDYILYHWYFKKSVFSEYRDLLINTIILSIAYFFTLKTTHFIGVIKIQNNTIIFFVDIIICVIVPNILFFFYYRNSKYFDAMKNICKLFLSGGKKHAIFHCFKSI